MSDEDIHTTHLALLQGLLDKNQSALDRLIAEFSSQVLHLAAMILRKAGTEQDAEEVASDVFAAAWQRADEYNPARSSFRGWILMLTKYAALERRHQLLRQSFTPQGESKVIPITSIQEPETDQHLEDEIVSRDRQQLLHRAIAQLSEQDRSLIIRRYFLEEPISQMANDAGLSRNAMDNRLWRARQTLKKLLQNTSEVTKNADEAL